MNVGLLEDDADILELFAIVLSREGHRVEAHGTGQELLRCFFTEDGALLPPRYDVLVVDLGLPGGASGEEVIERLHRELPPDSLPRIIVVSAAHAHDLARVRATFPSVLVLGKPLKLDGLRAAVAGGKSGQGTRVHPN